jgi:hypothetical protein
MVMVNAIANATLTALFTGESPKDWKDLVAFRTGNLDEHGRPERFMLPTYEKDLYAYANNFTGTLANKTHPLISLGNELANKNKDYYGTEIRHKDDNPMKQLLSVVGYTAKAFVPFWIRGTQKEMERGGSLLAKTAPMIGVMPAPSDMNKTAAEKLMGQYGADRLPQGARTQQKTDHADLMRKMYVAFRKGDESKAGERFIQGQKDKILNATDFAKARKTANENPLKKSFAGLTYEQASNVMDVATKDEKAQLEIPFMRKKMIEMRKGVSSID